jgi:ATP-binding cassette, subfamily B, bacterial HlyB/CyaB
MVMNADRLTANDDSLGSVAAGALSSTLHAFAEVARRLGVDTSPEQLRRSYVFGETEPADGLLIAIAREIGLDARAVSMRWRDLSRLSQVIPAILRLSDGGALILEGFRDGDLSGEQAILRDPTTPAGPVAAVDEDRLARAWDGRVLLLKRRFATADETSPFGLGWLLGQVLRERKIFRDIGIAALIGTLFAVAPPFLFMIVLDRVLTNHSVSTLIVIAGALALLILFEVVLGYLRRMFTEIATTRIDARLNLYIFERLLKLPMEFFERNPTGVIAGKLGNIWHIRRFLTGQLFGTFLDAVTLLGLVPALVVLDWRLSAIVFALAGAIFLTVYFFLRPLGRLHRKVVEADQLKGAHLIESIHGMRTIKSLALEGRRRREWDGLVAGALDARHALGLLANYPQTLTLPFERLMYSGVMVVGALVSLTSPEAIYPGALVAFAMLSIRLGQPLVQLARLQQDLAEVRAAVGEVAAVMNAPPEPSRSGYGLRLPIAGAISFHDVCYRYTAGAPYALDRVSFEIPQGRIFGIMGRSGSGKTTLTRLLQGLQANYEGIIKIDGMDLREIDLNHLRTNIGVVLQENFLFRGSIRDNIAVARSEASFAEIVRAAQLAGAEEFIERMPRGYETVLEEGATNLSGGQRQRLAIARALLIDPPVLILDEATSALDAESEAIINANLMRIARGRTIICISHRLSMLVPADAILVLERGKVYDIGRHEELLYRCDIYKHLWNQQNRHVEQDAANVRFAFPRAAAS